MSTRVLLIDDDTRMYELLEQYLGQQGIKVTHAPDGGRGLAALDSQAFDAVLLDVMMPGMDGLEVCRRIRSRSTVPILMLTARGDETDRVVGLELGADDYLAKPFSPRELLARLRAVLRRAQPSAMAEKLEAHGVTLDVPAREARVNGRRVELTGLEFDLLVALVRRAGRVIPRDALLGEAGRSDTLVGERTVDVHISHLRQKLGEDGAKLIKTVRGVGYLFAREGP
ncbi:response regulator transcription factor [Cystobacter ferrugineus]|uniref:DNA-binding response regulator n=1 Tax=Cystobacter ferrugineus TaxID=83449 RepID=A0A1L9BFE0_9BACT|nr:response regulator transcription factor [Cystobacter ferrugineus]OJH40981.1 DNA-binding response regulator [Cystobacter ferrugineus]